MPPGPTARSSRACAPVGIADAISATTARLRQPTFAIARSLAGYARIKAHSRPGGPAPGSIVPAPQNETGRLLRAGRLARADAARMFDALRAEPHGRVEATRTIGPRALGPVVARAGHR